MTTIAEKFAANLKNDGQLFETDDGVEFEELAEQMGAKATYANRAGYDEDGNPVLEDGYRGEHFLGDPVRFDFPDGSAVVQSGEAWDLKGAGAFSWAGLE